MEEIVLVLTTVPEDFDAAAFARTLIEERLAACVNVLPPQVSTYRWDGAIEVAREHQVVIKTTAGRLEALHQAVRRLHPYDLPEFLVVPVLKADPGYALWVRQSTAGPGADRP